MSPQDEAHLRKAVRGLVFQSQIDAPFKLVAYPADDGTEMPALQLPADTLLEEGDAATFFGDLCRIEKWHAEDDRALIRRYCELVQVLRETLGEIRVFRAGGERMSIHLLGRVSDGSWAGLETIADET